MQCTWSQCSLRRRLPSHGGALAHRLRFNATAIRRCELSTYTCIGALIDGDSCDIIVKVEPIGFKSSCAVTAAYADMTLVHAYIQSMHKLRSWPCVLWQVQGTVMSLLL